KNDEANLYLARFSKLTRQILENATENYISLADELQMTDNYLAIQQLLYNGNFKYRIDVDENIAPEDYFVPPMLTQPFIENAVKHGLAHVREGGLIAVRFTMENKKLIFEVTDTGKGLEQKDADGSHKSMAAEIVKERLQHHASDKKDPVEISNITIEGTVKGVRTRFEIPYLYEN
ncbi:MAG TPA: histidine kinase, partial [Flavobacterium sp.]|nr:histidine kinase [Flavobacterium sp.]